MNRDEAKQLLPIIQAFADDKQIQFYIEVDEQWKNVVEVSFQFCISRERKDNRDVIFVKKT